MNNNIFLGLHPYMEDDAYRFKGRSDESKDLFHLIVRNDYTVCYAESGEGKTSLLNAGVFPLLRGNRYFPIEINFNSDDFKSTPDGFDEIINRCIKDSINQYNEKNQGINVEYVLCSNDFQDSNAKETLDKELENFMWWKLRNYKPQAMGTTFTPVFVFDQFEEVFNMPNSPVWTKKFFDWLESVSSNSCPKYIIKKVREIIGNEAAFPDIKEVKDFKAIFSLRKEFIGELDYWGMQQCFIPELKNNRFCLKPLTFEGAKKVMSQQKRFEEKTIRQILYHLVNCYSKEPEKTIEEKLPVIPALLLSVVCDTWEKDVSSSLFDEINSIDQSLNFVLEKFYEQSMEAITNEYLGKIKIDQYSSSWPELSRIHSRDDIDNIVYSLVDMMGRRERVKATSSVLKKLHFDEEIEEIMSNHRIIKITKIDSEDYVELVHDSICPIVAKKKEEKLAAEIKAREELKIREREKEMKRILHRRRVAGIMACTMVLFFTTVFSLFYIAPTRTVINKWANPLIRYAAFNDSRIWTQEDVENAGGIIGSTTLQCDSDIIIVENDVHLEKLIVNSSHPCFQGLSNCPNLREISFTNHVQDVTTHCWCGGLSDNITINIGDSVQSFRGQLFDDLKNIRINLSPNNNYFQLGTAMKESKGIEHDSIYVFWHRQTKEILYIQDVDRNQYKIKLPEELKGKLSYNGSFSEHMQIEDTSTVQAILSDQGAYAGTNLRSFNVPHTDSIIGEYAFMGCKQLQNIKLNNIQTIGSMAFANCTGLEFIDLSEVRTLSALVFQDCKSLSTVTFPKDSIVIGAAAFEGCSNLQEIHFPKVITIDPEAAFRRCSNLHTIILPDSIVADDFYAPCFPNLPKMFSFCYKLNNITFSEHSHFNWREDSVLYYDDYPAILNCCTNPNWASKDSTFYFENGILFMKDTNEIYNDSIFKSKNRIFVDVFNGTKESKGIYPPMAFSSRSYFFFESRIGETWPYLFLLSSKDTLITADQFPLHIGTFTIVNRNADIKEIHLPYAEPKMVGLDLTQGTLAKENINLYVPYSHRRTYLQDSRFRDFKEIIEEDWKTSIFRIVKDDARLFFSVLSETESAKLPGISRWYPLLSTFFFISLLFSLCCWMYKKSQKMSFILEIAVVCVVSWYVFYWLSFHYFSNRVNVNTYFDSVALSSVCSLIMTILLVLIALSPKSLFSK